MRYLTAGESHGRALVGILEGLPAGLPINKEKINEQLKRRQGGYGRGGRMKIEQDQIEVLSGIRAGVTLGSPIALVLWNRDWENWGKHMDPWNPPPERYSPVTVPRPGHADLAGALKYRHSDIRNVLERASARETAMRVALGSLARQLLAHFGIGIASHVVQIHSVRASVDVAGLDVAELNARADASPVRCLDPQAEQEMIARIDAAQAEGNTVGGVFEVIAANVPVGLGSYVHWDRKLDGRIAQAMASLPAMKAVEIGLGGESAARWGSECHDEIFYDERSGYSRATNRAGGLEGGVTNGERLIVRVAMKPLSTLRRPLASVDMKSKQPVKAHVERSDVCAVPAASVIGEAVLALVLADAFLEKYGGDSLAEIAERVGN
ncbi:MAG: chorismate synthase, partial [Candidatus Bipolaricaulota bacterium]|nr:chorismate synthase [Candidatus Bipolaricaulota bacterium]